VAEAVVPALLFINIINNCYGFFQAKTHLKFSMRYKAKRYNSILFPVINNRQQFLLLKNYHEKEGFIIAKDNFSNLDNHEKSGPAGIFKFRHPFQSICKALSLFLSGAITLKTIFHHFQHYIFKKYKSINEPIEKPTRRLFNQYPVTPLALHLAQWRSNNEAESLIHLHYAQIKRNPE
jgi:hypothetical protein